MKKLMKLLMVFMISLALLPLRVMADSTDFELTVTAISKPTSVIQDKIGYGVTLNFDLTKKEGASAEAFLSTGDTFELDTNLGDLFEISDISAYTNVQVLDGDNNVLANVTLTENKLTLTIAEGANGTTEISNGQVVFQDKLKAKNVGAGADNPKVTKTLTIGSASATVAFNYQRPGSATSSFNPVDIDTFWENAGNKSISGGTDTTGATFYMEVNPIGSMDLYGSTTYEGRTPKTYDQLYIENTIPEHGFIDEDTMQIYAAIPEIGYPSQDSVRNGYFVSETTLYAVRNGTIRQQLNTGDSPRITRIYQDSTDTLDSFREKIRSTQLQWGIFEAEDGTQTFLCNFGAIGTETNNNGIMYSDYYGADSKQMTTYADIFGSNGASHGNIVSYYIEFDTYYPEIVGAKSLTNNSYTAFSTAQTAYKRNDATYTINNGGGTGVAKKRNVIVKVVEEGTSTPIANAKIKLQKKDANGNYVDCVDAKTTDENGLLSFGPLGDGDYKLVQTETPSKYEFDNTTYGESGSNKANKVTSTGEFAISSTDKFGFGSVVTNKKSEFGVSYEFQSSTTGMELPQEVLDLLPTDSEQYEKDTKVKPASPSQTTVNVDGGYWTFDGYTASEATISNADVTFIGKWSYTAVYSVSYEFQSNTAGKELPQDVLTLLPVDTNSYTNNTKVKSKDPASKKVSVEGGYWTFDGYTLSEATIHNADVTFVGKWSYIAEHTVSYTFQSNTEGMTLPQGVIDLLPSDSKKYVKNDVVQAINPSQTKVPVDGGYWTFDGYDNKSMTVSDTDVIFIGEWSYVAEYTVSYRFQSNTADKELPDSVLALLPTDTKKYTNNTEVTPTDPSTKTVTVNDGYWTFEGYTVNEATVNNANVQFTGLWKFTAEYTVNYDFVSTTDGKDLPAEIEALLPSDTNKYTSGTVVKTINPSKTKVTVNGGYWTFDGYVLQETAVNAAGNNEIDPLQTNTNDTEVVTEVTVGDSNIVFIGMWSYTAEHTVNYEFQSNTTGKELPQSVLELLPSDSNKYVNDTIVKAIAPSVLKVTDGNGYWTFEGYTLQEATVKDADITFAGMWSYTETKDDSLKDSVSPEPTATPTVKPEVTPTPSSKPSSSPTNEPTITPKASAAPSTGAKIVDTGDSSNMGLFAGMLVIALAGFSFLLAYKKKNNG